MTLKSYKDQNDLMKELNQKIFRPNKHTAFIIVNPKNDPQLPNDLKNMYNAYDFIMLEYGVPMMKNSDTDMIII